MKIAICGDIHVCKQSSIVNTRGETYSARLENCVKSINWFEALAAEHNCTFKVYLGDFFNKPELDEETITAVQDIKWAKNIPSYIIVGNHESTELTLKYSSAKILEAQSNIIFSNPNMVQTADAELCFLPYITESNRQNLVKYFPKTDKKRIIFSHNDISGINYGPVESKIGFSKAEIEENCDYFINGHLHNGGEISKKIINLGILTGKDFGEDAATVKHNAAILDTDLMQLTYYENPHAFNFYKINIEKAADLDQLKNLKNNAVLSIKCLEDFSEEAQNIIDTQTNITKTRFIIIKNVSTDTVLDISDLTMDHLEKFVQCCHENIDNSDLLDEELLEICK